jgi:hypothetical protein
MVSLVITFTIPDHFQMLVRLEVGVGMKANRTSRERKNFIISLVLKKGLL